MPENALFKTIEQERAMFALDKVGEVKNESFNAKYKTRAKDFPAMVLSNGLLQSLTFLFSKQNNKDESYKIFLQHIYEWFKKASTDEQLQIIFELGVTFANPKEFIEHLTRLESAQYRHATTEALAISVWFKRFADALIEKEE